MIVERLNEAYSSQATEESKRPWYPRPSGLGGCLREMAHLLKGEPAEPRTPESMRLLELGQQRGEELERRCRALWPDAETQVAVQIPVPWGGKYSFSGQGFMHGTVDLWIPSLRTIVDFKTAGAYSMGLIVAGEKEDEGYALQLNAYRHGMVARYEPHEEKLIPEQFLSPHRHLEKIRTILVYEAKDSDARKGVTAGMLHEVEIPYTALLENLYQQRLQEIWTLLQGQESGNLDPKIIPGMPHDPKTGKQHWKCRCNPAGRPLYCSIGPTRGHCV